MSNIPLIIDIILLIILFICAAKAFKDGFFTSIINLIGKLVGVAIAWFLSNQYSSVIFSSFFRQNMIDNTYDYLQNSTSSIDTNQLLNGFSGVVPEKFMKELASIVEEIVSGIANPNITIAEKIVDTILAPVIVVLISVVIFTICFIIFNILISILSKFLKIINHVPVLGLANKWAGAVVGVIEGGIYVILISCILSIIAVITQNSLEFLNIEVLSQSKILAMTSMINPFMGGM